MEQNNNLQALLDPQSIAVIGASNDPTKISGRPIEYLTRYGYQGSIYPINPKYSEIQGFKSYPSIGEAPAGIDLVIIAIPGQMVLDALRDCHRNQVKSCIVFSSGFAELGDEGRDIQQEMTQLANQTGMRIIGPNCQGVVNVTKGSMATFSTSFAEGELCRGSSAIISQSGAVAAMVYRIQKEDYGQGIKYWVATGNEADATVSELIEQVVSDPDVKVIQAYLEDVKDGEALIRAAKKARELHKPILALKSGKTEEGKKAASSHTGALAAEDAVFDAIFHHYGVVRVDDVIELAAFPQLFKTSKKINGKNVAILSNSGGLGVMMVDQCKALGLDLAVFRDETKRKLAEILPVFASVQNPIDVTAQLLNDRKLLSHALPIMMSDPNVDIIILALGIVGKGYDIPFIIEDLARAQQEGNQLIAVSWVGSQKGVVEQISRRGVPAFEDPSLCVRGISKFVQYNLSQQNAAVESKEDVVPLHTPLEVVTSQTSNGFLSEYASKRLLRQWGLIVSTEMLVKSEEQACDAARSMGFPVVLKVSSPHIQHKTEIGGVVLNITNENDLIRAYQAIMENSKKQVPQEQIEGLLVQEMVGKGFEISLGMKRDPAFGPMLMVASGGIYIEVLKDFQLLVPPVTNAQVRQAVQDLVMAPLLQGTRGKAKLDVDALCQTIVSFSQFVMENQDKIEEVDLNPVIVLQEGQGVKIVDALIKLSDQPPIRIPHR
jgi:acyl-CoA synthetase (NDP forming)